MTTTLIVIGKTNDERFRTLIDEYVARVGHYMPFNIEVIPELKQAKNLSFEQQKDREAELLQKSFKAGDYIVLLDEHGKERRSIEFSQWMQKKMSAGPRRLVFVVGGPYGFARTIHEMAHEKISLSQMTFSHQMIRLLFVEQIYRAMTILHNEPYHHE